MKTFFPMTMITVLLLFIFGCTSCKTDQLNLKQIEQIKSEAKEALTGYVQKWTSLDTAGIFQYYSSEMYAVSGKSLIDYQAYKKMWGVYISVLDSINAKTIYGDFIVLTQDVVISAWIGNVELLMKSGDKITTNPQCYTDILKKTNGHWKIVYEQSSGIPVTQKAEEKK